MNNIFTFNFEHKVLGIVSFTPPRLYNGYHQSMEINGNTVTLKN